MINATKQSLLWSVLSKYDGNTDFIKFCDSLSNFIQNKITGKDFETIYKHFTLIDKSDYQMINEAIGTEVNNYFFQFESI